MLCEVLLDGFAFVKANRTSGKMKGQVNGPFPVSTSMETGECKRMLFSVLENINHHESKDCT